ncbi:hypothetical protein HR060_10870 [Catenovulum sp. SM1970]|uniref:hypothetical protein n=1 Tax=Marinifaba aquimaris TaxID=2741323 RepID=UPI001572C996|nr:hypothetical protein [Marinifaba aquimaris]NTS77363.1 hypothetical protein [Marinifaba aquimaris]
MKQEASKPERRSGNNFWHTCLNVTNVLSWLILLASLLTFEFARPEHVPGYSKYKGLEDLYRTTWNEDLTNLLFIQLLICSAITLIQIIIIRCRARRKNDYKRFNLFLLLIISVTAAIYIGFVVL